MANRKHFITKKLINYIIQKYGGGHRWSLRDDISERDIVTYTSNDGRMLTINLMWEGKENQFPYIEVHITDKDGIIIRKDRYDYSNTDKTRIEFVYTEENGHFYDEFRKVGVTMARPRQSKEAKIKELEKRLADTMKWLEDTQKRNAVMAEQAEQGFLNSPTYYQMQQELEFFKSLSKLNDIHLASAKKQTMRADEHLRQVYEDNKRMCEHEGDTEYWIGITECWREAKEYEKLREEIRELKGKVEQQEQSIADRDAEIHRLQMVIGEFKCENPTTTLPSEQSSEELETLHKENQELTEENKELSRQVSEYWQQIRKLEGEVSRQKTLRLNVKSEKRQVEIELENERMKKYDQYVPEDAASYQAMVHDLRFYKHLCEQQTEYRQTLERRIKELEEQVSDLATTTLPTNEAVAIIEQNIEQAKEIKVPKKSGRPPKVDSQKMALIVELKANGHSIRSISEQLNMSVGSVHRYIKMNEKTE